MLKDIKIKTAGNEISTHRMVSVLFRNTKGYLKIYKDGTVVWMDPEENALTGKITLRPHKLLNKGLIII